MQALLHLRDVAYRYDDASGNLFEHLSLTMSRRDRLVVIGDNGTGKSTLLTIAAGLIPPDRGEVTRAPDTRIAHNLGASELDASAHDLVVAADTRLSVALTRLRTLERAAAATPRDVDIAMGLAEALDDWSALDGWSAEAEADALLHRFGVPEDRRRATASELSGGERARVVLAATLASRAELLILDEPSEHLDDEGSRALAHALSTIEAAVLLVSHDRALLESTATSVLQLERGRATHERVGFTEFEQRRAEEHARQSADYERSQQRAAALERAAHQRMATARTMLVSPNTGKPTTHFHYRKRAAKVERTAKVLRRRIDQVPAATKPFAAGPPPAIDVSDAERGPAICVRLEDVSLGWGASPALVTGVSLAIGRGEHLALIGPNGCGKSTVIASIMGSLTPRAGVIERAAGLRIAYVGQLDDGLAADDDPLAACVRDPLDRDERRRAMAMLAALRVRERALGSVVGELSAGTRRKVALARALLSGAHLLVLDEPTNHLDLAARDALGTALASHPAALVIATHDRALLDRIGARTWSPAAFDARTV